MASIPSSAYFCHKLHKLAASSHNFMPDCVISRWLKKINLDNLASNFMPDCVISRWLKNNLDNLVSIQQLKILNLDNYNVLTLPDQEGLASAPSPQTFFFSRLLLLELRQIKYCCHTLMSCLPTLLFLLCVMSQMTSQGSCWAISVFNSNFRSKGDRKSRKAPLWWHWALKSIDM